MRHALAALLLLAASAPAAAAGSSAPSGLAVTAGLGGGAEVGRSSSRSIGELELGVGYDLGFARPEAAVLVGLAPGNYLGARLGLHVDLPGAPMYARGAFDWAHQGGDWHLRWLLLGLGTELSVTSVLSVWVEADLGIPVTTRPGVGVLGRAGFTFRF